MIGVLTETGVTVVETAVVGVMTAHVAIGIGSESGTLSVDKRREGKGMRRGTRKNVRGVICQAEETVMMKKNRIGDIN